MSIHVIHTVAVCVLLALASSAQAVENAAKEGCFTVDRQAFQEGCSFSPAGQSQGLSVVLRRLNLETAGVLAEPPWGDDVLQRIRQPEGIETAGEDVAGPAEKRLDTDQKGDAVELAAFEEESTTTRLDAPGSVIRQTGADETVTGQPSAIAGIPACHRDCSCGGCPPSCCDPCHAVWSAHAGVMFLHRSNSTSVTLITEQNTAAELLNTGDLAFDHDAATWLALTRQYRNCWGWDLGYVGLTSWNAAEPRGGLLSPVLQLPGGIPVPATGPGIVLDTNYSTDFHIADLNLRYQAHECVTLLAGFRWVELSDTLSVRASGTASNRLLTVDTDNHLYGFQLGADCKLLDGRYWSVAGTTRAGMFYNRLDQNTVAPILAGITGVVDHAAARDDHTAFVGEIGLQGELRLSRHLSLTAGYRLFWLEGLALAPDQLLTTNLFAPGSATVADGGSLLLNGANVGLNFAF